LATGAAVGAPGRRVVNLQADGSATLQALWTQARERLDVTTVIFSLFGGADATSGNSLVGGSGSEAFVAGTGSDTFVGGAGANQFVYTNGSAGGNDFIVNYTSSDTVELFGYGSAAGGNALAAATVAGGNTTIALSDNTKITFENISAPNSIKIFST
jgi:Ca2+-binding RTX toxin-like protein